MKTYQLMFSSVPSLPTFHVDFDAKDDTAAIIRAREIVAALMSPNYRVHSLYCNNALVMTIRSQLTTVLS